MRHDLLLLSNSTIHGRGYLEHAIGAIGDFLGPRRKVLFAPFALKDHDWYTNRVAAALTPLSVEITGLHAVQNPRRAVEETEVLFVGGGNTFRLLLKFQRLRLIEAVRRRVEAGELAYLGSSAGSNLACPTVRTTNDMPIVQPDSLDSFGLIPFQINPHYVDRDPDSRHMGEAREERILQFLEENDVSVLGMREGSWLRRQDRVLTLGGEPGAMLFRRGTAPVRLDADEDLSFLLHLTPLFDSPPECNGSTAEPLIARRAAAP